MTELYLPQQATVSLDDVDDDHRADRSVLSDRSDTVSNGKWIFCGTKYRRQQVVYFSQITLIYVVVISAITNLSLQIPPQSLWISLLASCIGYLMPQPTIEPNKNDSQLK